MLAQAQTAALYQNRLFAA